MTLTSIGCVSILKNSEVSILLYKLFNFEDVKTMLQKWEIEVLFWSKRFGSKNFFWSEMTNISSTYKIYELFLIIKI